MQGVRTPWRPPPAKLNQCREAMYAQGGVFSITSRILIADLLSGQRYTMVDVLG